MNHQTYDTVVDSNYRLVLYAVFYDYKGACTLSFEA